MSRIGFFCFLGTGHLYPALALARRLKTRGHQITVFHVAAARAAIRAAGVEFSSIDDPDAASQPANSSHWNSGIHSSLLGAVSANARRVLGKAPEAIKAAEVDALIVDQADLAAGSVADSLGLPFVTLSTSPPAYLDDDVPPAYFSWRTRRGPLGRLRNRIGNALVRRAVAPVLAAVNDKRKSWGLKPFGDINETASKLGIVTQIPEVLDFPMRKRPDHLFYAGPLVDSGARSKVNFPWHHLSEKPLIYASMGTILNDRPDVFRLIAQACSGFSVQLVISLGGGSLLPEDLGPLPGNPLVVHYAPQLDILKRASLTITHSGLNTTLESLDEGVPLLAIPVNNDQPGIAARVESAGAGCVLAFGKLSLRRLQEAVANLLANDQAKQAAMRIKMEMRRTDALESSCNFIEQALGLRFCSDSVLSGHLHANGQNVYRRISKSFS